MVWSCRLENEKHTLTLVQQVALRYFIECIWSIETIVFVFLQLFISICQKITPSASEIWQHMEIPSNLETSSTVWNSFEFYIHHKVTLDLLENFSLKGSQILLAYLASPRKQVWFPLGSLSWHCIKLLQHGHCCVDQKFLKHT